MRALIQRVSESSVTIDGDQVATIGAGMLVLLGVAHEDDELVADKLVQKLLKFRMFSDESEKMNLNVEQVEGDILIVSQFTLMADTEKGLRPGFSGAAAPDRANSLYEYVIEKLRSAYLPEKVQTGRFAADMQVALINDGPVTFVLETGS